MAKPRLTELDHGITVIDTEQLRPGLAAAYLVVRDGEAAFVECGTNHSVPMLLAALEAHGLLRAAVRWVMPTHVHLDHAGGAGSLMQDLPQATLVAHPRAARHLIDPSRLWQGVVGVYGEDFARREYGELVPIPGQRVVVAEDGHRVPLGGGELVCIDTPGHARHHYSVWDAASRGFFSGDTFGLSYREFDTDRGAFVLPTTTPVQFDPPAWHASLDRYLAMDPQWMYLTHYGRVGEVPRLAADLRAQVDAYAQAARGLAGEPERLPRLIGALTDMALRNLRAHGCTQTEAELRRLVAHDMKLNAQGLEVWLQQQ